jgi:membrane associated rhomboid family serine protease
MKDYLVKQRPRISLILILILFVSNIITLIFYDTQKYILLFPSLDILEPWNWYRLITYPLYVGGLITWLHNSLVIVLTGYIIENRLKKQNIIGLILLSSIIGGLIYIILNHDNPLIPIASPAMITWGYWAAAIVIGLNYWKSLILFEKIVLILCLLSILSIWNDNFVFLLGQIIVIVMISILTLIQIKIKK